MLTWKRFALLFFSLSFLFFKKTFRKTNSPRDKILERSSGSGWWGASVCMTECQYKDWFTAFYWERPVEIRRNKTSALIKATVQPVLPLTFVLFLFFQDPSFSTTYMTVRSTLLLFTMVLFSCRNWCPTFATSKQKWWFSLDHRLMPKDWKCYEMRRSGISKGSSQPDIGLVLFSILFQFVHIFSFNLMCVRAKPHLCGDGNFHSSQCASYLV